MGFPRIRPLIQCKPIGDYNGATHAEQADRPLQYYTDESYPVAQAARLRPLRRFATIEDYRTGKRAAYPTMHFPSWLLPRGVSRSLWEYAHDPQIARQDDHHLAGSPLVDLDRQVVERWLSTPGSVIDLGCGTGRLLVPFAQRGYPALGVDLSFEALQVARERAAGAGVTVGLLRANLCELDALPGGVFDYALLMFGTLGMVEGDAHRRSLLRHARRLLKPGGKFALHAHNVWSHLSNPQGRRWLVRDRLKWLLGRDSTGDTHRDYRGIPHMYHHAFTRGELLALLAAYGFAIDEVVPVMAATGTASPRWLDHFRANGWIVLTHATAGQFDGK